MPGARTFAGRFAERVSIRIGDGQAGLREVADASTAPTAPRFAEFDACRIVGGEAGVVTAAVLHRGGAGGDRLPASITHPVQRFDRRASGGATGAPVVRLVGEVAGAAAVG